MIPVAPSASTAYGNVRACEACFTLHQTEAALVRAERRLAAAVGGSTRAPGRGHYGWKGPGAGVGPAAKRQVAEAEGRGKGVEGRGSWASSPQGEIGWSSDCGGGGRRGLRGSRSADSLGGGERRRGGAFFGKREVSGDSTLHILSFVAGAFVSDLGLSPHRTKQGIGKNRV